MGQHKRLMKILAAASEEDIVRILHVASNCGPLLSDMDVKAVKEQSYLYYGGGGSVMVKTIGGALSSFEALNSEAMIH